MINIVFVYLKKANYMKQCKKCGVEKPLTEFKKHPETRDRLSGKCKPCINIERNEYLKRTNSATIKKYEKTKKGFLVRMFRNMKSRVTGIQKAKYHLYEGKGLLDKEVFYNWALNNSQFHLLFDEYQKQNYNRKLAPSVDRIDSSKGYELENMEFITHSENSSRGAKSKNKMFYDRSSKET